MAKRILGMGDVVGIIEKAQEAADAEQLEAAERMLREGFTMNDMLDQMKAVKKMGGMKGILGICIRTPISALLSCRIFIAS